MSEKNEHLPGLDYRAAPDDEELHRLNRREAILGALLSLASVLICVFLFVICNLQIGGPRASVEVRWGMPLICAMAMLGSLAGIAYQKWRLRRSSAFAAGMAFGIGVAMLIEGLCFAALRS